MKKLQKGFTLIELMIVVAIIAILAAVAAPRFGLQIARSRDGKAVSIAGTWQSALALDYSDREQYATAFGELADDVDNSTIQHTFNEAARTSVVTGASTANVFLRAGTVSGGTNNSAQLAITTTTAGVTTLSAINFTAANGNNTRGNAWNTVLFN